MRHTHGTNGIIGIKSIINLTLNLLFLSLSHNANTHRIQYLQTTLLLKKRMKIILHYISYIHTNNKNNTNNNNNKEKIWCYTWFILCVNRVSFTFFSSHSFPGKVLFHLKASETKNSQLFCVLTLFCLVCVGVVWLSYTLNGVGGGDIQVTVKFSFDYCTFYVDVVHRETLISCKHCLLMSGFISPVYFHFYYI